MAVSILVRKLSLGRDVVNPVHRLLTLIVFALFSLCRRAAEDPEDDSTKAVILNYGAGYHSKVRLVDEAVPNSDALVLNVGISVVSNSEEIDVATTGVMNPHISMWDAVSSLAQLGGAIQPRIWVRTDKGVIWPQTYSQGEDSQGSKLRRDLVLSEVSDGGRTTFRLQISNGETTDAPSQPKKRGRSSTRKSAAATRNAEISNDDNEKKPPAKKKGRVEKKTTAKEARGLR